MVSETFAAQVVMLAIGQQGVTIKRLQELMRPHAAPGDARALKVIKSANRFNLSEAKLRELLPYIRPAVRGLIAAKEIVFDELTRQFYFVLDPNARPVDAVAYLNMDLIRRQWTNNNAYDGIMPTCQGLWRVFRISTPSREDEFKADFYDGDFDVSRGLLVIKHAEQLRRENQAPEFSFYQRGSRPGSGEKEKRINGHLLPAGNRLVLLGQSSGTFDARYVSVIVWALDVELHNETRDALGLLTNSSLEQIAAPLLCQRVLGSERFMADPEEFARIKKAEMDKVGVMAASEHAPELTQENIAQLRLINRKVVLRLT